jgi:hypothetical protein
VRNRGIATVIVAIAVGLASACSSPPAASPVAKGTTTPATGSTPRSSPAPKPLSRQQLVGRLLTVGELAPGLIKQSRGVALVEGIAPLCSEPLPGGDEVTAPVSTGFDSPASGVIIGESLSSYTNGDAAQTVVASAQHAATSCDSYMGGGNRQKISPLALATIGGYSFAVRLSYGKVKIDVVYAQVGSTVMLLALAAGSIRSNVFRQLANLARQKVTGV